jgi:hypothetical protein
MGSAGTVKANGTIDYGADTDVYKVTASKSGVISATMANSGSLKTMVPQVTILDAQGNVLSTATASAANTSATASTLGQAGSTYYVQVSSGNQVGNTYSLTIKNQAIQAPVMQAISPVNAQEGTPVSFIVTASDPNGLPLTYSATNLPTGSTFDPKTQVFSWTPATGQAGTYNPTFTASNGSLTASQTAGITVTAASTTPTHTDTIGGWAGASQNLTVDTNGNATYSSWIDTASDTDMFKYVATKTGTLTINAKDTSATPTMLPRVNFYDANCNQLANNIATSAAAGATKPTMSPRGRPITSRSCPITAWLPLTR